MESPGSILDHQNPGHPVWRYLFPGCHDITNLLGGFALFACCECSTTLERTIPHYSLLVTLLAWKRYFQKFFITLYFSLPVICFRLRAMNRPPALSSQTIMNGFPLHSGFQVSPSEKLRGYRGNQYTLLLVSSSSVVNFWSPFRNPQYHFLFQPEGDRP